MLGKIHDISARAVVKNLWSIEQENLQTFSDSDFAVCRRTAKSTSGGGIVLGLALSSEETKLKGVVKCSCDSISILQLAVD